MKAAPLLGLLLFEWINLVEDFSVTADSAYKAAEFCKALGSHKPTVT